jgi:hypothetical protein
MNQTNDELHQQLLELAYDLLSDDEAAALRRRIDAEPDVARAYAEAQREAKLFAAAARLHVPHVQLVKPDNADPIALATGSTRDRRDVLTPDGPAGASRGRVWAARGLRWVVGIAAAVLIVVTAGGYARHRAQVADIAADHLRLVVSGPAKLAAGLTHQFTVQTTSVTGKPLDVDVQCAAYAPGGATLLEQTLRSGSTGQVIAAVPPDVAVPNGSRFEVLAVHRGKLTRMQTELSADERRFVTQLALDKPLYQPGETVFYRSLTLGRFGLDTPQEMPIHFEIRDPSGAVVPGSELEGVTERGVGSGSFRLPPEMAGGRFTLTARAIDDAFPEERRPFFIRRYRLPRLKKELEFTRDSYAPGDRVVADFAATRAEGGAAAAATLRITATVDGQVVHQATAQAGPSGASQIEFQLPAAIERGDAQLAVVVDDGGTAETIAKTIRINLGKVDVRFFAEGGDLVADLENRVYFVARNPVGEPVHIEGQVVDAQGREVAKVETAYKGMGLFTLTPKAREVYSVQIAKPADVVSQPRLPDVNAERRIVLAAGAGVFEPGRSIELDVRAARPDLPLVVSAYCRGVQVGQQALVTRLGSNRLAVPIAAEAAGVVRLTVFDYSAQPPQPIAERLVYRRPDRRLDVRVAAESESYSPGDPVQVSLMVTNERGEPTPAVLGVAVVDDALLKMADDDTPKMPTHFYLTTEVEKPEDLEKADFYLSDDAKAPAALDLLLGTQGWRRFVETRISDPQFAATAGADLTRLASLDGHVTPPTMFDNLTQAQSDYQAHLAAHNAGRQRALARLGSMSLSGGLVIAIAALSLAVLRLAPTVRFCVPTLAAATACLVMGLFWMNPQPLQSHGSTTPLFARFAVKRQAAADAVGTPPLDALKLANEQLAAEQAKMYNRLAEVARLVAERGEPKEYAMALLNLNWADGVHDWGLVRKKFADIAGARLEQEAVPPAFGGEIERFKRMAGKPLGEIDEKAVLRELGELRRDLFRAGQLRDEEVLLDAVARLQKGLERFRFPIREYAHKHVGGEPGVRSDFAETVFWHPMLITDDAGRATARFDLSDSVTTFRVLADAHNGAGRIGGGDGSVVSRIPFSIEPKLPLEVNAGDRIELPVAISNDTRGELPVTLTVSAGHLLSVAGDLQRTLVLRPSARSREHFTLDVLGKNGFADIEVRGAAGRLADAKKQAITVVPAGFPVFQSYAGRLEGDVHVSVNLPDTIVPGSLEVSLAAFPSTLADLQKGVESILREPYGCFEQASTSNYPNVLTMQYMQEHKVANPEITRRARDLLKNGYAKLTAYECKERGYEWFGGDPGHEALTAYGLMEFRDMADVYPVDRQMIERTSAWLLARRDGKGGFQRNPRALDSFGGAPPHITDAYIVWALTESGERNIANEIAHVIELGKKSDDPYLVALAAASAVNGGQHAAAKELLDKLAEWQAGDGHFDGREGSITRSGGLSLTAETTALAALAFLKVPTYHQNADKAVDWLVAHRQGGGGWGSTQATILALKALVEHARANRKTVTGGELVVSRDGEVIGRAPFGAGHDSEISIADLAAKLAPGENRLMIRITGDNAMPYALDVRYRVASPPSDAECPVRLTTSLAAGAVRAGDTVALQTELVNTTDRGQPMTIAIIGLPAGLQPRADQLEELKKAGTIDYYETRAREVVCYWRSLAPSKRIALKLDLVAEWPGRYTGPASRAYLYYTAEQKHWAAPLAIEIGR